MANAPTTKYSTSFEFNDAINSRKSLLKRIGVVAIPQFENNIDLILRRHLRVFLGVCLVGFLKIVEYPDSFLHRMIIRLRATAAFTVLNPHPLPLYWP